MFGAYYFHKQSFAITAITQRFIYFLLFYSLLHVLKPKPKELINIILYIGIIFAVLYLIQSLIYPVKLYSGIMRLDRGTLRIAMEGSGFLFLAYLIGLTQFIKTYDIKYLLICILTIVIFILLGTRQIIAPAALVTILAVLFSKKIKSKPITIILLIFIVLPVYFLFKDIFGAMIELTQHEAINFHENSRFKAAIFFLTDFFPNRLSYFIGNGVPSDLSPYGIQVNAFNKLFGFYQSDIGIIGDYSKFGILFVIAQISIYVRITLTRLPGNLEFVKLNIIASLVTILIGSSFNSADYILIVCISLYLVDISSYYDPVVGLSASVLKGNETSAPNQQIAANV
jgi:hypothetical protein